MTPYHLHRPRPTRPRNTIEISLETDAATDQYLLTRADALRPDRPSTSNELAINVELFKEFAEELGCLHARLPVRVRPRALQLLHARRPRPRLRRVRRHPQPRRVLSGLPGAGKDLWIATRRRPPGRSRSTTCDASATQSARTRPRRARSSKTRANGRARTCASASRSSGTRPTSPPSCGARRSALLADYHAHVTIVAVEARRRRAQPAQRATASTRCPGEAIDRMLDRWEAPTVTECHALEVWSAA